MKCVNCGKELNESAKFCDECGTPVNTSADEPVVETVVEKKEGAQIFRPEGASTESEKTSFTQKLSVLPMKTKLFIGAGAAVIVILLIVFFASLGGTPTNGGNVNNAPYDTPANDDFGNNEVITAIPTEQITQATEEYAEIEIIYPDVVTDKGGFGAKVKMIDCQYTYISDHEVQFLFTVEKVCGSENRGYTVFAADIYYYDSQDHLLKTEQALFIPNFDNDPNGKQYKCTETYYSNNGEKVAKVEIVGR